MPEICTAALRLHHKIQDDAQQEGVATMRDRSRQVCRSSRERIVLCFFTRRMSASWATIGANATNAPPSYPGEEWVVVDAAFKVLGPVQVCRPDGREVHLTGKQRAVLATLLVNANTLVAKERLIAALWEDPPPSAVPNLITYIAGLRKALPTGTRLATKETGYLFEAGAEEVDLLRFEQTIRLARSKAKEGDLHAAVRQYENALSMWRGKPAEGTRLVGPMLARVAELEDRLGAARLDWAEARLALGQPADVIEKLRLFIAEQPLHERAWHSLMLAHSQAGQRGGFNRSSQHPELEVLHGEISGVDDDAHGTSG
ncbi:BTAD domain-containing putative transcriptional regulator, partial [Nonomuraea sp. NPDC050643]|uniref:AfsR/SARP family transcriptional regulator n=1 Tax=Nonomuraea sp. NPDC050643 TaxID=3155660 RepID=UPI0033DFBECE